MEEMRVLENCFLATIGERLTGCFRRACVYVAVLENLLQSIDLANAMRLIQKQTVIPSGIHDVNGTDAAANSHTIPVSPNARSTFRNSGKGNGKVAEMFVPVAPPPILNSPNQQDATPAMRHHKEAATAGGNGHGHVAFTHPAVEVSDSEDAHSVRSGNHHHHHHQYTHSPLPLPTQGRASRLSTSSSIPSGLFGSRRHVSTPTSLVSGNHNINNNTKAVESGTTKTQLFMAGAGAVPEPNNKHKRSISERFSLNRHLLGHGKKGKAVPVPAVERSLAGQVEVDEEVAMEAKDMAKFQGELSGDGLSFHVGFTDKAIGSLSRCRTYSVIIARTVTPPASGEIGLPSAVLPARILQQRFRLHQGSPTRPGPYIRV